VVFFATDAQGRLTYISASVRSITGSTPGQFIGRHFSDFIHSQDLPHLQRQFAKLSQGMQVQDEYRVITPGGGARWVLSSSKPVFDRKKAFTGIVGVLTDVHRGHAIEETFRETEEQFHATFDLAGVGIAHLATDWTWLRVNETLSEIIGYSPQELRAMRFADITHPQDRAADQSGLDRLAQGIVQTVTREKRVQRKDGFTVSVNCTISAMRDPSGAVRYYIAIIEDITGRKRLEDTLQLLRTAVESIPLGITVANLDGRIVYVNPAEGQMHGYRAEELLGREARTLAPADQWSSQSLRDLVEQNRLSDIPFVREGFNVRKDGSSFPVTIHSVPVRDMRGVPLGLVSVAEDITDRKRMIDALRGSEQRYRSLVDNSLVGVFISTIEGRIIYVNEAHARLAGYDSPADMMRVAVKDLYRKAEDRMRLIEAMRRDGRVNNFEFEHLRKDGSSMTVMISASLDGDTISGMMMDVTDRRRAEEAISAAKRDWESTFDTITDMITIHDENFNIIRSNKAAAEILGLPWVQMGRAKCYEFYHGADAPPAGCPSCLSLRTRQPSLEERYEPHLGKYLEIRAIPRLDDAGNVRGLIHVVRDITTRKQAEEERARLEARLREAEKLQVIGSLAGGVAHEVRNPLNAIMALTDALDREVGANPEYHTFMHHMRTQVERLSTLMTDLLELGKPVERAKLRTERLRDICILSIDAWKQSRWGRGRKVVLAGTEEGPDLMLEADAKKLQQVFINLLDNAAQHSEEGSPIALDVLKGHGSTSQVRVVDRGSGIPEDVLPKVFDTFFTTRRGGTGLGLSIVKHIVELHGGAITLSNNAPLPGSTATVILPVKEEGAR
jgi:PAS domain S-box-containing protein